MSGSVVTLGVVAASILAGVPSQAAVTARAPGPPPTWAFRQQIVDPPSIFSGPSTTVGSAAGDYDDDGDLELAVADPEHVVVYEVASGGGALEGPDPGVVDLPASWPMRGMYATDVDGDGIDDLAIDSIDGISMLLSSGGGLTAPTVVPVPGLRRLVPVQWDADPTTEFLVGVSVGSDAGLRLLDRSGGGWVASDVMDLTNPEAIEVADLDEDGDLDVITSGPGPAFGLEIRLREGSTFTAQVFPDYTAFGAATGDLDGDGHLDIAANGSTTLVLHGDGDGSFSEMILPTPSNTTMIADVGGDGRSDLLVSYAGALTVFSQQPNGVLSDPCRPGLNGSSVTAQADEVVDLDGDGLPDIVTRLPRDPDAMLDVLWGDPRASLEPALFMASEGNWGEKVHIEGILRSIEGCPRASERLGTPWELLRSHEGLEAVVQTGTTDDMGRFETTDRPPDIGIYTYSLRFPGTATYRTNTSLPRSVTIYQPAKAISVKLNPWKVGYREATSVIVHLDAWKVTGNDDVTLSVSSQGTDPLDQVVTVDPDTGTYRGTMRFEADASVTATWSGDGPWHGSEAEADAWVHVILTGKLSGHFAKEGREYLVHQGRELTYLSRVRPVARDVNEKFRLQQFRRGKWRMLASIFVRPNRDGYAGVRIVAGALDVGTHYRIGAQHPGQTGLRADSTPWTYIRVVGGRTQEQRPPPVQVRRLRVAW